MSILSTSCGGGEGDSEGDVTAPLLADGGVEPVGFNGRPANPSCVAFPRPTAPVRFRRVFADVALDRPLAMLQAPRDNARFFVLQQGGKVLTFGAAPGGTGAKTFIDVSGRLGSSKGEAGLLGMAFSPDWPARGAVYLSYTAPPCGAGSVLCSRISRFRTRDGGATLDPASEQVILEVGQPDLVHNGGNIAFGPDGYLYIGLGDGGPGNDPKGRAQDEASLLGKMLRIDVSGAGPGYTIPPGNPLVGGGGRPEIWASGFRNPWRWSFDRATGALWLGDVGQGLREEINLVTAGANYGWRRWEGTHCKKLPGDPPCSKEGLTFPMAEYTHQEGQAVTGGFVYRGASVPALVGKYIYGDYLSGRVWAIEAAGAGVRTPKVLRPGGANIASFAQDNVGELYLVDVRGNTIHKMEASGAGPVIEAPKKLSQTGCFVGARRVAGTIYYEINSPLWSDGVAKNRFLAIPDGTRIEIRGDGDWEFPIGSILIKTFRSQGRDLETRLLVRHEDGDWAGYPYVWDASGTDATLAPEGAELPLGNGKTWSVPSSAQCLACHTAAAGRSLGLETAQLNRERLFHATGVIANQLTTLEAIGMFAAPLPARPWQLTSLPAPAGTTGSVQDRARSYLHANCSHCHRPDGPGLGGMDLRYGTPFRLQGLCNVAPSGDSLGLTEPRLLAPRSAERSVVVHRVASRGEAQMPPLATKLVHRQGVSLLTEWADGLSACPPP